MYHKHVKCQKKTKNVKKKMHHILVHVKCQKNKNVIKIVLICMYIIMRIKNSISPGSPPPFWMIYYFT